ncbi:MAG TPA: heme ABC transporter permease, partial [Gammaproteobacteria bacterium]|nr:heme ABC transporter permease [Gammaproteobacteria bacterium]
WWNTLHQGASISRFAKPAIDNAMLYPLLSVLVAMYMLYIVIVCIKARYEILWRERGSKWVKTLLEEQTGNA